ncbi:Pex12 amino terminal region-domain-containing protein [Geopyxis carbonaria]|nr:Pex12 amino terminal region-domain-containing protein [Geopyxis carbonaria]
MDAPAPASDANKPSLFELLSESQLRELLEPSLRYVLALATQRHPRYLIRILNRWDEAYALLMLLVERHYLSRWGGSFTENFYGLKRERATGIDVPRARQHAPDLVAGSAKLGRREVWRSLFVIVGVPYLKRKLDDAYEIHAGGAAANVLGANFAADEPSPDAPFKEKALFRLKALLRAVYPSLNAAYYFSILAFNLAFLFDRSHYHTPIDWLVGVRMRRLTAADHRAFEAAATPKRKRAGAAPFTAASLLSPTILSRIILPKLLDSLKVLLPTSIFFLKFLEWWHASDFARQLSAKTAASIELPPPVSIKPPPPPPADRDEAVFDDDEEDEAMAAVRRKLVAIPADSGLCAICTREITNPTAVQTGYVFCYPCVFRWVADGAQGAVEEDEDRKGRCPVTGVRLLGGTEGLRRLMI